MAVPNTPNFINPSYATPEQLSSLREYSKQLMTGSGQQKVQRAPQGFSNIVNALVGGYEGYKADQMQTDMAKANAERQGSLISQLQNGQKVDPQNLGQIYADPLASPESRALVTQLINPQKVEDVAGRPGYASPVQGVQAAPIQGNFQPGFRASETAGSVSTVSPVPAAMPGQRAPVQPSPRVWGDAEGEAAGIYPPRTPQAAPSGGGPKVAGAVALPAAPAPAGISPRLKQMAAEGQQIEAEGARVKAGAEGEGKVILGDVTRAASAPETLKGLGIMKNTIQSVGDQMTFGPTAKFSNEARRVISNYAPGLVDEKALAGADAIEKLNLGLAGTMSQQLGLNPSDIYRSVASVPGNEKSKTGTLALINMMEQQARNDQYVGTTLYQQYRGNLAGYQEARAAYYANHPIVNPITGNPIEVDAQKAAQTPANAGPVAVSSPEEAMKLPKGTRFRAPDGSIRMVP